MAELTSIWTNKDLTGAAPPSSFNIPNDTSAASIKINNQSRFWLILSKQTGADVDRIEPFSYLIIPNQADLALRVDTGGDAIPESNLNAVYQFVDFSTMQGAVGYMKGSTQFNGTPPVSIAGDVNVAAGAQVEISNAELPVSIQGTPVFNIAAGAQVDVTGSTISAYIAGTPTFNIGNSLLDVSIQGTPTFNLGAGAQVQVTNSTLDVAIQGTPVFNLATGAKVDVTGSTITASLAAGTSVSISNSSLNVAIQGTPTMNLAAGTQVTIANSTLDVAISGTPTFALAAGSKVDVTGSTITANLAAGTSVSISNSSLNVAIQGTPTMNLAAGAQVTIANSTLDVAIQGTPVFNLATGAKVDVTGSTITASISGTPTFNIGAGNTVQIGNKVDVSGSTITASIAANQSINISNSSLNVAIQGTPTFNIAAGNKIDVTGSTITANLAAGTSVAISNSSLNVAIQGTPTMNLAAGTSVTIESGSVSVAGVATANINNDSLPISQIYSGYQTQAINTTAGTYTLFEFDILPAGKFIEIHRGVFYVHSEAGQSYNITVNTWAAFEDGHTIENPGRWLVQDANFTDNYAEAWTFDGNNTISNQVTFELSAINGATLNPDNVTIYFQVDCGDTAIETAPQEGVPIMAVDSYLQDFSGTITTGGTAQNVYTQPGYQSLQYLLFQNLSSSDMYISFGDMDTTGAQAINVPGANVPGSIMIPANGGSIVFENTFVPNDSLNVICATTGAVFTCKYILKGGGTISAPLG